MCLPPDKKRKRRNKTYAKEIEAAWHAVIDFISPFDYVIRYTDENDQKKIITVNPNCVLASQTNIRCNHTF